MHIKLYIKPWCGWCHEAIDWLNKNKFTFETLDITSDGSAAQEMRRISGQSLTPTIDIDGQVLPDFSVDELKRFLDEIEVKYPAQ